MKTTAEEFRKRPHDVYEAASQGEEVVIKHDRHRKIDFVLTSRDRMHDALIKGAELMSSASIATERRMAWIADAKGVYAPNYPDNRFLTGIKSQESDDGE